MTRSATAKLTAYAGISGVGLLAALVFARPELVALTAPFLLALCAGLALATPPRLTVDVSLEHDRALEGDDVAATVALAATSPVDRLDVYVRLPDGRYLVSASRDQSVRVWDLEKGASSRTLPHPCPVLALALSPIGNVLLSGGADRIIRAWHLDWVAPAAVRLANHEAPAWAVDVVAAGRAVASRGTRNRVHLVVAAAEGRRA